MNYRNWLNNWLKPSNIIALLGVIVACFGVFTVPKLLTDKKSVNAENKCEIDPVNQESTGEINSDQNVSCSGTSKIKGVIQKQTK